jgi:beta-1,4-mannooligosaccharide/beta-1,4-mannosyl-N-acetylglucosamine phosphorylase
MIIKRCAANPLLTKNDVPFDSSLVFNAGVTKFNGKYVMVFRNDYGSRKEDFLDFYHGKRKDWPRFKTNIGIAFSDDGISWKVSDKPCFSLESEEIRRAYDPRLSVIDGRCYLCFAVDTHHGIRGGIAVTDDFENFEILSMSVPDNRNMVLFPEKINDKFVRLERPFPVYGGNGSESFDIWISDSPDCRYWGNHQLLLGAEKVPFSNCKIGPAAPPIKTPKGWLTTFHATKIVKNPAIDSWYPGWNKVYCAGLMLLDLNDPSKIIGKSDKPLMVPETKYEKEGFRGETIFPGGMVLEDSGEVKIYYGAADTVECLATAHINDLLKLCGV